MVSNIADINKQELEDDESIFRDLLDEIEIAEIRR